MGSGLILLVIVGAWLAVLVPMALRSHDASSALGTVDKFHDAMRVLSRRDGAVRAKDEVAEDAETPVAPQPRAPRPAASPLARRRRALGGALLLVVATLVAALVGPVWLWAVHAAADAGLVGVLVWLRQQAVRRAELEWRAAMATRRRPAPRPSAPTATLAPEPVLQAPRHVAGVPSRMPSREEVLGTPVAAPLAPVAQAPARGAQGEPWQPVPVPVPTYVNAPTAPRRVLDLTSPAASAETLAEAERSLGIDDQGPELDEILDRRRAAGDW